ncbi:hypothetical protein [uncultured Psychroserpens sp.]|uniref:hypothetical protein n=1 Tax=uncultured Psychroserpens sp. TaxID=255436 RepID=UPI0026097121|nr:hypothetical protein [uncultured Psychroserpens sp.]
MKTNNFKLTLLLLCLGAITTIQAQGLYNLATLDEEEGNSPLKWSAGIDYGYDDVVDSLDEGVGWANSTIGGSAGFGWNDNDGNSETSFCVGAEYLHRISRDKRNPNGAGYVGAYVNYHNSSADNFDESLLRVGAKYTYFDRITAFNEVQLTYGAGAYYDTGSLDFSGFDEDVTGYGASLYFGANFRLCDKASIGVEVPVISFVSRTFESNGNEVTRDNISAMINKNNPAMFTFRYHLGDSQNLWDRQD